MENYLLSPIKIESLLEKFEQVVDKKFKEVLSNQSPENSGKLLSRKEVAKALQISLPTLNVYTKEGWLKQYKIGNRVLYKQSELAEALEKVATYKHKRIA